MQLFFNRDGQQKRNKKVCHISQKRTQDLPAFPTAFPFTAVDGAPLQPTQPNASTTAANVVAKCISPTKQTSSLSNIWKFPRKYQTLNYSKNKTFLFCFFDDVIGNVRLRASGGIGDLADHCMRGAVDV